MQTTINIDGQKHEIASGLTSAKEIYELVDCGDDRLFLNRPDDVDVPVSPSDYLIIQGEATFVTGESPLEDNPPLRRPVNVRFNGRSETILQKAKITGQELKQFDKELPQGRLFADIESGPDVEISDGTTILVQDGNSFFVIPVAEGAAEGGPVDIEGCGKHGRRPPKGHKYRIRIDRETRVVEEEKITGAQILVLVDKTPQDWALNQKLNGGKRERIKADAIVEVSQPGVERFETVRRQAQQGSE